VRDQENRFVFLHLRERWKRRSDKQHRAGEDAPQFHEFIVARLDSGVDWFPEHATTAGPPGRAETQTRATCAGERSSKL
jgi:hypothetical protein